MWQQLIRRLLNQSTAQHQQKLIDHLAETELMTKAARKAHQIIQATKGAIESGQLPSRPPVQPPKDSLTHNSKLPLGHEELTAADHARARGVNSSDFLARLRLAKAQLKSDAAADWKDIKDKFTFRK